jgi:phospholipid/cholesterol/gamma-HCH transport system permease protein
MGFVASHSETTPFRVEREGDAVRLLGRLRTRDAAALLDAIRGARKIDVGGVEELEGGVAALLSEQRAEIAGAEDRVAALLDLYRDGHKNPPKRRKAEGTVAHIGRATIEVIGELKSIATFVGEMTLAAGRVVKRPRAGHFREVPSLVERAGADAVPIVLLINFLLGFVMAYQSARQLQNYGANIYVADLVGISVARELAPLMSAIIVCGRTGAAYAAEIGSMNVDEEIDALRTLGLTPHGWLVVPRIVALVIIVPILTLLGDVFGVLGGLLVGVTSLDVTAHGYLTETRESVMLWDVESGLLKSVAFAIAIGLIACQQGFGASGGASGVGRRTTSTVVTSLFALVLLDALFTIVFRLFGK